MGVPTPRRFAAIPGFGFLYSHIALLVLVPTVMIFALAWGLYPHSKGIEVRTTKPATLSAGTHDEFLIVTVLGCANCSRPTLYLNSRPVLWEDLQGALRAKLSRRPDRVVYVEGDNDLPYANIVNVVDIIQEAWYGVSVVLLTPELKKKIEADRSR